MIRKNNYVLIFTIIFIALGSIYLYENFKLRVFASSVIAGVLGYLTILFLEKKRPELGNLSKASTGVVLFALGCCIIIISPHPMGFSSGNSFIFLPIGPAIVSFSAAISTDCFLMRN